MRYLSCYQALSRAHFRAPCMILYIVFWYFDSNSIIFGYLLSKERKILVADLPSAALCSFAQPDATLESLKSKTVHFRFSAGFQSLHSFWRCSSFSIHSFKCEQNFVNNSTFFVCTWPCTSSFVSAWRYNISLYDVSGCRPLYLEHIILRLNKNVQGQAFAALHAVHYSVGLVCKPNIHIWFKEYCTNCTTNFVLDFFTGALSSIP